MGQAMEIAGALWIAWVRLGFSAPEHRRILREELMAAPSVGW